MSGYISKENVIVRMGFGLHQIVGGSIGLYLILIEPNVFLMLRLVIIIMCIFSIYAGYNYFISSSNLPQTKINYLLQIIVFQVYDLISYKYFLPFSFSLSFDMNSLDILFNFYLQTSITLDFDYQGNSIIGINILSLLIFLFLSSEKGISREILDYDI